MASVPGRLPTPHHIPKKAFLRAVVYLFEAESTIYLFLPKIMMEETPSGSHIRNRLAHSNIARPIFNRFSIHHGRHEHVHEALNHAREKMGLRGDIEVHPVARNLDTLAWSRVRLMFREPFLEFWGAFIMVLMGDSVIAQSILSKMEYGNWLSICLGWSCAYMFGIYVAGDSGAYLNPAVTLTNCLFRGLPLRRFPIYAVAQILGSFCAHGVTYANYIPAFDHYEGKGIRTIPPNKTSSAKVFCTFPAAFVPRTSQFFSEYIANFISMFCLFAMRDENGADLKGGGWFVLALFWLNFGLMSSLGWETGSPINPARDVTGRIWLSILGYDGAWSAFGYWSWIPIVVPFLATFSGAMVYDIFVYTGESPVNTPGLGLVHLLSKIRGVPDETGQDEEKGETPPSSGRTEVGEETGEWQGRRPAPCAGTEGVEAKDEVYNRPRQTTSESSLRSKVSSRDSKLQKKTSKDTSYDEAPRKTVSKDEAYDEPSGSNQRRAS